MDANPWRARRHNTRVLQSPLAQFFTNKPKACVSAADKNTFIKNPPPLPCLRESRGCRFKVATRGADNFRRWCSGRLCLPWFSNLWSRQAGWLPVGGYYENSGGAATRRVGFAFAGSLTVEIRKRARKSGEFPEQCVVSIRVSVGVAMRWTLVQREQERESKVNGEWASERGRQRSWVSPSYPPPLRVLSRQASMLRATVSSYRPLSHPLCPRTVITSANIQAIVVIELYLGQIRWNRPANTVSKKRADFHLWERSLALRSTFYPPFSPRDRPSQPPLVLCSTYVSRVGNNVKDRRGTRIGRNNDAPYCPSMRNLWAWRVWRVEEGYGRRWDAWTNFRRRGDG